MAWRESPAPKESEISPRGNPLRASVRGAFGIKPKLGKLKAASVTSEQVEDFMLSLSRGSAGRTIGLLGVMFSYAVKHKLRADNPVRGIEKPKDVKHNRRLSQAEYAQLGAALRGGVLSDIFQFLRRSSKETRLILQSKYSVIKKLTTPKSFSGDFKVPHAHWAHLNCTFALFETGAKHPASSQRTVNRHS